MSASTLHARRAFSIDAADGLILRGVGELDAPQACIFLHGFGDNIGVWSACAEDLTAPSSPILLDLRGHGASDWDPRGRYTIADHVRDLRALITAIPARRYMLIGHSMAGAACLRFAFGADERLAGLVLIDTAPAGDETAAAAVRRQLEASQRSFHCVEDFVAWLAAHRPLAAPAVLRELALRSLKPANGGLVPRHDPLLAHVPALQDPPDIFIAALASLTTPTLLVRGSGSALLSSRTARELADASPALALVEVPAAGHAVMTDNPRGLVDAARPFIEAHLRSVR